MPFPRVSDELYQLENDIIEVYVTRTKYLEEFPLDYQVKIADSYRFSAWRFNSRKPIIAPRIRDTLEII